MSRLGDAAVDSLAQILSQESILLEKRPKSEA